jgi:hypothetical protein
MDTDTTVNGTATAGETADTGAAADEATGQSHSAEALRERLLAVQQDLTRAREALDAAERRHAIDLELLRSDAVDLETARLMTEAAVMQMSDKDAARAVADLKRRKPFLFRRPERSAGGAMGPGGTGIGGPGGSGGPVPADEARQAAAGGDRVALLRYLRSRRAR